jgi:hypothetical protein
MKGSGGGSAASGVACALVAGAVCGGLAPDARASEACTGEPYVHLYRLKAAESAATDVLEQALAVLKRRLSGPATCTLEGSINADGTLALRTTGTLADGPLVPAMLAPGVLAVYPVLAAGTQPGPGIAVLPGAAGEPVTVRWVSLLHPDAVAGAEALAGVGSDWIVRVDLAANAAAAFADATAALAGETAAIAIDDRIVALPVLVEPIAGGAFHLEAGFSRARAEQLAAILGSGPLPLDLDLLSIELVDGPVATPQ